MVPSFRLFLSISANGVFMYSLVFMRNIAGMPSGRAAEFFFRFQITFNISSSLNNNSPNKKGDWSVDKGFPPL